MVQIKSVGVIGAGQMGTGIAHVVALGGYDVLLRPLRKNAAVHAIQAVLRFISWETDISGELTAAVRK